jgi:hypothetical protein
MEEDLLSIIDEIECLRRLDKYDENPNTFVLIYRLEQQYQQILEKIKEKESKCSNCKNKFKDEKHKNYYEELIVCDECLDLLTNGPAEEDTDMAELVELVQSFNAK